MADLAVVPAVLFDIWALFKQHILFTVLVLWIGRLVHRRYFSPLSSYPGPFLASFTRLWKVWSVYKGHAQQDYIRMHRKYGPIVRVGPSELSFASPTAARDILAPGNGFTKTEFYNVFPPKHAPDIFTETREWKHAAMKRVAVVPYSLASVQKMSPWIEDVQKQMVLKVGQYADSGKICNLGDLLHWFAFDVVGEFAFSQRYGFLQQEKDVGGAIKFIDNFQWYNGLVGQVPELRHILLNNPLWQSVLTSLGMPKITEMALNEVQKRRQTGNAFLTPDKKDLLGQLIEGRDKDSTKFSDLDIFAVSHGAIGAGADSTASTMQSFCHFALSNPDVYSRLKMEIRGAHLSPTVGWQEAQDLPYFQACLLETMRMRPAVGLSIPRYIPATGARIDGRQYPGGMVASVNAWVVHRDEALFGELPDKFRPERWLNGDTKEMKKHMYQFGGGGHLCIGRNLAQFEMNKVLPQLIMNFDFELVQPGKPLQSHTTFFVVQKGLEVLVKRVGS